MNPAAQISAVMAETGMGELQASRHVRDRAIAQRLSARPCYTPHQERFGE